MKADIFFESRYLELYEPLFRYLYRFVKDAGAAEDLLQEVFLLAWNEREALLSHPNPDGWFYMAARNKAMNYLRLECRKDRFDLDDDGKEPSAQPATSSAEDEVLKQFFCFEELKGVLSEDELLLLRRRFGEDLALKELALDMGVSEGTLKMRFSRIFAKLRKHPEVFLVTVLILILEGGLWL